MSSDRNDTLDARGLTAAIHAAISLQEHDPRAWNYDPRRVTDTIIRAYLATAPVAGVRELLEGWAARIDADGTPSQIVGADEIREALSALTPAPVGEAFDWRDDPSADERWSAGLDFAMDRLRAFLHVDPQSVTWDAATETLDGDVSSVIGNILRAKLGEDWGPTTPILATPGDAVACDVLTMQHSSGFPDYFTRVRKGDRELTFFMSKIKSRCEYHAAELNWLLNGAEKPHILDFDATAPEGLAEYIASTAAPTHTQEDR